jgi:DNA-binding NtrC family response regulator
MLLVVEDEPDIREWLEQALARAGFEVATACDGWQAMAELNKDPARFGAVISDIRLGAGPDGWEVVRYARQHRPDVAAVYITGDSREAWPSKGVPGSVAFCKPFASARIIAAVSTLLVDAAARRMVWNRNPA